MPMNSTDAFCSGTMVMYMSGFTWGFEDNMCLVFLFPALVLDTRGKYVVGLFVATALGVLLELLGYIRRRAALVQPGQCPPWVATRTWSAHGADVVLHVGQLALGYCLMLLAMTYHIPIFLCVLLGLGLGQCISLCGGQVRTMAYNDPCCPVSPISKASTLTDVNTQREIDASRNLMQTARPIGVQIR
jgi:hypothetical protein